MLLSIQSIRIPFYKQSINTPQFMGNSQLHFGVNHLNKNCVYCGEKLTIAGEKYLPVQSNLKSVSNHTELLQLVEKISRNQFFGIPESLRKEFDSILARLRTSKNHRPDVIKREFYRNKRKAISVFIRECEKHLATKDHIQPRSRKGPTNSSNLAPCCRTCNDRRKDLPLIHFLFNGTRPRTRVVETEGRIELTTRRSIPTEQWKNALNRLGEFIIEPLFAEPRTATKTKLFRRKNRPKVKNPEVLFPDVPSRFIGMAERLRNILLEVPHNIKKAFADECLEAAHKKIETVENNPKKSNQFPSRWKRRLKRVKVPHELIEFKTMLIEKFKPRKIN